MEKIPDELLEYPMYLRIFLLPQLSLGLLLFNYPTYPGILSI